MAQRSIWFRPNEEDTNLERDLEQVMQAEGLTFTGVVRRAIAEFVQRYKARAA